MSKLVFTGCEHLGHYNIIRYCDRPFQTTQENDKKIIENFNLTVKDCDTAYHLGDFCLYSAGDNGNGEHFKPEHYIKQLNGNNIFIAGNHDRMDGNCFKTKNHEIILNHKKLMIQLIHDPQDSNVDYPLILHSHVHNEWKIKHLRYKRKNSLLINCGVDVNNFKPVTFDEILTIYFKWLNVSNDYNKTKELLSFYNKGTNCEKQTNQI